jgi:hypothetical protein
MKQGNDFPGERILSFGQVGLVLIAGATSQANIFKGGVPAFGLRMNVVKARQKSAIGFASQAVAAAIVCSEADPFRIALSNLGF